MVEHRYHLPLSAHTPKPLSLSPDCKFVVHSQSRCVKKKKTPQQHLNNLQNALPRELGFLLFSGCVCLCVATRCVLASGSLGVARVNNDGQGAVCTYTRMDLPHSGATEAAWAVTTTSASPLAVKRPWVLIQFSVPQFPLLFKITNVTSFINNTMKQPSGSIMEKMLLTLSLSCLHAKLKYWGLNPSPSRYR